MDPYTFTIPWIGLLLFARFVARFPTELPEPVEEMALVPSVSVIIPARNEEATIVQCIRSIAASDYPDFEIIVVDDRSEDHTAELARSVPSGNARQVLVIDGRPLPEDWLGKPWACHQGQKVATGEILLFTDADTTHGRDLLRKAVSARRSLNADLFTVVGRQEMETFWERLVQPQVFFTMFLRFPDFERTARNSRWRDAIANGQYLLFPRASYDELGGHESVYDEVVEDLALAQRVKRLGFRLRVRGAEADMSTRMYRSLPHMIEGWSKNIVTGGLQSVPPFLRPVLAPVSFATGVTLWLLPPLVLLTTILAGIDSPLTSALFTWSATVVGLSVVLWMWFTQRMGAPAVYGLIYPLGAAIGAYIFLRSWLSGRNVEWKGRRYELRHVSERP